MKKCSLCNTEKEFNNFYKNKRNKDGFQNCCKNCLKLYHQNFPFWQKMTEERNKGKLLKRKEKYREYRKKYNKKFNKEFKKQWKKDRLNVLNYYGKICNCCGEKIIKFLCIDHIKNDGYKHRKENYLAKNNIAKFIIKNNYPKNFQILCWNCNMGKSLNKGICPHKIKLPS